MIIFLSLLVVFLLLLVSLFIYLGIKSSQTLQQYELFFDSTMDDLDSSIHMLQDLMKRRQMISDDPDVQNVYKMIVIIHDILLGYQNAGKQKRKDTKK
jgi:hypothetical protein